MKIYEYKGRRYQFDEADAPAGAVEVKSVEVKPIETKTIDEPKNKAVKPVNKGRKASTK